MPFSLAPEILSVVVSVTTFWENASAQEVESDVVEQQERRLGDLSGLVSMTSISQPGRGQIRLEFQTGTDINEAMARVDQKLSRWRKLLFSVSIMPRPAKDKERSQ